MSDNHLLPPQSKEMEACALGSLFVNDCDYLEDVIGLLTPEDFYQPVNRDIYKAILHSYRQCQQADLQIVAEQFRKNGELSESAGKTLTDLLDRVPSGVNGLYYARKVKDLSYLRQVIAICNKLAAEAYESKDDIDSFREKTESELLKIWQTNTRDTACLAGDIVSEQVRRILENPPRHCFGLQTGFPGIDSHINGLCPGELVLIASRPGIGKSSLCLNMVREIALRQRESVLYVSLEMGRDELIRRMLANISLVPIVKIKNGSLSRQEECALEKAQEEIQSGGWIIDDCSTLTPMLLKGKARKWKQQRNIKLLIVDYVQMMHCKQESRFLEISFISRALKELARELHIPVIGICQLNRQAESRPDKRPHTADLKESGSLEQDADVVMLIYRKGFYFKTESGEPVSNETEVTIAKNRNGPTGLVFLTWQDMISSFFNITHLA